MAMVADADQLAVSAGGRFGEDSWEAMLLVAGDVVAEQARRLLRDGRDAWVRSIADGLADVSEDVANFLFERRASAAIDLLARLSPDHRTAEDLALVRAEADADHWRTREAAGLALATLGSAEDVTRLLEVASKTSGATQQLLLAAALRFGGPTLPRTLVSESGGRFIQEGARAIAMDPQTEIDELLGLLRHENDAVRLVALEALIPQLEVQQLETLLDDYAGDRPYYYNVIAALDRTLYGPPGIMRWTTE
jgi:hypothetical protein